MKEPEQDLMAAELRQLRPAQPPAELLERLLAAAPTPQPARRSAAPPPGARRREWWLPWMRWLVPASAVGLVTFVSLRQIPWALNHKGAGMIADEVQLSQKLVSSYDAVGELPGGEPVRFRVREWTDSTVMHDSARGLVFEQNTPRLEVIPVEFETY